MMQQQLSRRGPAMAALFLVLGLLISACSGPTPTDTMNAATVNGTVISMTQFQTLTRLLIGIDQINGASNGSPVAAWQAPAGKAEIAKAQKSAISLLITNLAFDNDVRLHAKTYGFTLAQVKTQENAKLKQLFSQVPAQFQPLEDQGLLTMENYRPFIHQQTIEDLLATSAGFTFATTHIKILTVRQKKDADALLKQLTNGGDWTGLAVKNSIDPAQSAGGDIASLVPHYLPAEIDQVVFTNPVLNKIVEVHSRLGWSLVEVLAQPTIEPFSKLDNTVAIVPTAQVSAAGAAVNGYIARITNQMSQNINVNWCGEVSGKNCPALYPADQI